ncbi:MAG: HAMP domain-containing protein [Pseudomarimonas sp.]
MRISLQTQIVLALLVLASLFIGVLAANEQLFKRGLTDQQHLALAHEVASRAKDIERNALAYGKVAPRDYESYGRDVLVTFVSLRADLDGLNGSVAALLAVAAQTEGATAKALAGLATQHAGFIGGLWEKLGDNVNEPRLEWGAAYLAEQAPILSSVAQAAEQTFADNAAAHVTEARTLTRLSWGLGLLTIAAIGLWFWRRVAMRIGRAAEGCRHVAEGEFGTRLEDASHDELGAFSRAFNGLSSRTRVVLGVLDRLPDSATPEQAFATLWAESRSHLGHRWQAMYALEGSERTGKLVAIQHDHGVTFADHEEQWELGGIIDSLQLDKAGAAMLADVRRHTLDNRQGRLLRELSRNDLRTLALVLLRDKHGVGQRVIAFAWEDAHAESAGVARFLSGLGRFLSRLLLGPASTDPSPVQA